jgi:hypothetical protein
MIADRVESLELEATRALSKKQESGELIEPSLRDASIAEDLADGNLPSVDSESEVLLQGRMLAEALYYYLASLSESREATMGERLCIRDLVTKGMGDALGLMKNDSLLKEFSDEFQAWIAETGSFTAGWGEIIWAGDGAMHLEVFPAELETSTQAPDLTFFHPYKKTLAAKAAAKIRAFAHRVGLPLLILI